MSSMINTVHVYYTCWPTLLYQEHTDLAVLTQRAYRSFMAVTNAYSLGTTQFVALPIFAQFMAS